MLVRTSLISIAASSLRMHRVIGVSVILSRPMVMTMS